MLSFQPSDKSWSLRPYKQISCDKFSVLYSPYKSISHFTHNHTYCPIVSFRLYLFRFKVLVNFGSQLCFAFFVVLLFFFCFKSVKHSCNMSTLLCVCRGGVGGLQWRVGLQLNHWVPSVLEVFHTNAAVIFSPPTSGPESKSERGGGEGESCCLNVSLRSHSGGQEEPSLSYSL